MPDLHTAGEAPALTPAEARAIAREAYVYGFPLVDNYRVLHAYFVDRGGAEHKAPWNELHHEARVYTPDDRAIQTPNADTPYSQLGTDLRTEPLVISVPAVEAGRYYSLQFIDLYTFNYAYVGSRTTGNEAGSFLLAGPRWNGDAPAGIKAVIRCETELGWVLFRTQLFDPDDLDDVRKVQSGYQVQPLSAFLGSRPPARAPEIDFIEPLTPEAERASLAFFEVLSFVLRFCPTHPSERGVRARFARLGIGAAKPFDVSKLSPEIRAAVESGMADAWRDFAAFKAHEVDTGKRTAADGFGSRAFLGNDYLGRMSSAVLGIYGNSKEEAVYPVYFVDSDGEELDASKYRYTLRFGPGQLPPVNAFWSLTMYELPARSLVANPLHRYLINSPMLPDLMRDRDGGLTLHLQHDSPGPERESNWLPTPQGKLFAVLRLYWPRKEALTGQWTAPPLRRTGEVSRATVEVTAESFTRAETDLYFAGTAARGGFARFEHNREPTPIDGQTVIRMNRDTLYSAAVFDLDAGPVSITLPDAGKRFLAMQVIDEDHYTQAVAVGAGEHTLSRETIGTRYVLVAIRTFADPSDRNDLEQVYRLQDAIEVEQKSTGVLEVPAWDPAGQARVREALLVLGTTVSDTRGMFGRRGEVDPVRHLIGSAMAWGGLPEEHALYLQVTPAQNDGATAHRLTVANVPVDGFWSVSVYDAKGYFAPNEQDAYTINGVTAEKNDDGTVSIQFGGCDGKIPNCLPITPGWNYMVRLYQPRPEVLDGRWTFPTATPV